MLNFSVGVSESCVWGGAFRTEKVSEGRDGRPDRLVRVGERTLHLIVIGKIGGGSGGGLWSTGG